jgi:hypothetical protein
MCVRGRTRLAGEAAKRGAFLSVLFPLVKSAGMLLPG